jgi:hypothetical protein
MWLQPYDFYITFLHLLHCLNCGLIIPVLVVILQEFDLKVAAFTFVLFVKAEMTI